MIFTRGQFVVMEKLFIIIGKTDKSDNIVLHRILCNVADRKVLLLKIYKNITCRTFLIIIVGDTIKRTRVLYNIYRVGRRLTLLQQPIITHIVRPPASLKLRAYNIDN